MIQFYSPEVWDTKQDQNQDAVLYLSPPSLSEAFSQRREINSIAMSEATVRQELYKQFAIRESIMKSQGITPAGDYRNPDELEAIDEQIAEINLNRSGDLLQQNSQVFDSVRNRYLKLTGEYERRLPTIDRFLVNAAADVYDYYTLDHDIDQFRTLTTSVTTSVALDGMARYFGNPISMTTFGAGLAVGYAIDVGADIKMNKDQAKRALGIKVDDHDMAAILLNTASISVASGRPSLKFRPRMPDWRDFYRPDHPMGSDNVANRTIAIYNNLGKNRPGRNVNIPRDDIRNLNQYDRGNKIIRDSMHTDITDYNSIRDFINEESAGAIEYFRGGGTGDPTTGDGKRIENFRVLLEGGGSIEARRKQFTRTFGEDGRILQWALDPKAQIDNEIKAWVRINLGDKYIVADKISPEISARMEELRVKYERLEPSNKQRLQVREAYRVGKLEEIEIKKQIEALQAEKKLYSSNLKERYAQIRNNILIKNNVNPSTAANANINIPQSVTAEIKEAQQAEKVFREQRKKELSDNIAKLRKVNPLGDYKKLREAYQERKNESAKARMTYEDYRDKHLGDSSVIIKQEKAKHATQIMFAKYLNELNIENRIEHLYNSSTKVSNIYNNAVSYLDQLYYQAESISNDFMPIAETMLEQIQGRFGDMVVDEGTFYEFLKVLFGQKSDNTYASTMANALTAVSERAAVEYHKKGINFELRQDFVPNYWDKSIIAVSDVKQFIEDLLPHVDFDKTYQAAGLAPTVDRRVFLKKAYKSLVSAEREPFYSNKQDTMEKRILSRRVIFFKSPDSYLAVMSKYGSEMNPIEMIRKQIFSHADNLAKISLLGNRPSSTINYMSNLSIDLAANKFGDRSVYTKNRLFNLHKEIYNDRFESYQFISNPSTAMQVADLFLGTARVGYLGLSGLSALFGDIAPTVGYLCTVKSSFLYNTMEYMYKRFTSAGLSAKEAKLVGIVVESAYRDLDAVNKSRLRFYGARTLERIEKLNGSEYITKYNKIIVNQILMEELASHSGKRFEQLPKNLHEALREAGMTHVSWDSIKSHTVSIRGIDLLNPRAIKPTDSKMQRGIESLQLFLSIMELDSIASYRPSSNVNVIYNARKAAAKARSENRVLTYMLNFGIVLFSNITQSGAFTWKKLWNSSRMTKGTFSLVAALGLYYAMQNQWARQVAKGEKPTNIIANLDSEEGLKENFQFGADSVVRMGIMSVGLELAVNVARQAAAGRRPDASFGSAPVQSLINFGTRLADYIKTDDERKKQAIINDTVRALSLGGTTFLQTPYERWVVDNLIRAIDPEADMYFDQVLDKKLKQGKSYYWAPGRNFGEQVRPDDR